MTAPATPATATPGVDTEEQAALRQSVAALLEKKSDSAAVRAAFSSDDGYDPALWATLVDQIGAAALSIPEEHDGAGATWLETHLVCEELGRRLTPSPMLGSAVLAAQAVLADHGAVDALVNCAGVITANLPFERVDPQDFLKCFNVNVMGIVHASQALHPALTASGGAIVNIASQAALVSLPDQSAYSASKGAVAALTRSMAIDWAPAGVRVNAICPGFTLTPMAKQQMTPELDAAVSRRVPLGRMFETEEIGAVIAFLVSPAASAVTGVVMPVDGGWTAG